MKTKLLLFCLLFLPVLIMSCDDNDDEKFEALLEDEIPEKVVFDEKTHLENLEKWNDLNLQNYSYEFGYSPEMDFKIEVRSGEVDDVEILGSSTPNYLTIIQIFQEIKDAYPENGEIKLDEGDISYLKEIKVVYNSEYFYPEEVKFIYGVTEPVEIDGFFHRFINDFQLEE